MNESPSSGCSRILLVLATFLGAVPLGAIEKVAPLVPAYDVTDKYVTSPTMLVRAGADGLIREIWSGMDAVRMRHVPLFLETAIYGEIRSSGGAWTDLRTLKYRNDGTRPGDILLTSEDGRVRIEIMARTKAEKSPIFVRYWFSLLVDFRLTARFQRPEFTQSERVDDRAGFAEFTTAWRDQNAVLTTSAGPDLYLATLPAGRTMSIDRTGTVKQVDATLEVFLCIDATESNVPGQVRAGKTYVDTWREANVVYGSPGDVEVSHEHPFEGDPWRENLSPFSDTEYELAMDHVGLKSDDARLDKLFACSIDAIESHQFASGNLLADLFFYRDSWIRDGSYTIIGLSLAGNYKAAERFFAFWDANRNAYVGGEREAQQPAIGVTAMWLYSRLAPDGPSFLKTHWSWVKEYCDHCADRIDKEGMMNVAEEWICFIPSPATWPNAEIYSGLRAGAKIAKALGQPKEEAKWTRAAERLKAAFDATTFDEASGKFIPMAGKPGEIFRDAEFPHQESRNGPTRDDRTDSGMLMVARMEAFGKGQGIVAVDDPRFTSTQDAIRRDLENPDHSIFRFGPNPTSPHAPQGELDTWPINTAWAAQDEWLLGRTDLAWRYLISGVLNKTKYDLPGACYYLPENWDRNGAVDKPMIVWSHGDFVASTMLLLLGIDLEPEGADLGLAPSLPPGMKTATLTNFRFRDWTMEVSLERRGGFIHASINPTNVLSAKDKAGAVLSIRIPSGRVIVLRDGENSDFTVDPSQYSLEFGRSRHALERAAIVSRVLNQPPPKPLSTMSPAELEDFIVKAETDFVPTAQ